MHKTRKNEISKKGGGGICAYVARLKNNIYLEYVTNLWKRWIDNVRDW